MDRHTYAHMNANPQEDNGTAVPKPTRKCALDKKIVLSAVAAIVFVLALSL
jgi:hypothetical protein